MSLLSSCLRFCVCDVILTIYSFRLTQAKSLGADVHSGPIHHWARYREAVIKFGSV